GPPGRPPGWRSVATSRRRGRPARSSGTKTTRSPRSGSGTRLPGTRWSTGRPEPGGAAGSGRPAGVRSPVASPGVEMVAAPMDLGDLRLRTLTGQDAALVVAATRAA